jgi:hypothetical protein
MLQLRINESTLAAGCCMISILDMSSGWLCLSRDSWTHGQTLHIYIYNIL